MTLIHQTPDLPASTKRRKSGFKVATYGKAGLFLSSLKAGLLRLRRVSEAIDDSLIGATFGIVAIFGCVWVTLPEAPEPVTRRRIRLWGQT